MAKQTFAGYWSAAHDDIIEDTTFVAMEAGLQAEYEERFYAGTPAGVITGLAGSISTTSIAVASGGGYAGGKRYEGGESISFVGAAAGTYFVYWDQSAEAIAKALTEPDTEEDLLICSVAWNGTTTLSALQDLRPWGVIRLLFAPYFSVTTATAGTALWACIAPWDCWIDYVKIALKATGSVGGTVVDVNVGNSGAAQASIFGTQANRASCTQGTTAWTVLTCGVPTTRLVTAGQVLTIDVDQVATGAVGLLVQVYGRIL
jgi:hypothetical protein